MIVLPLFLVGWISYDRLYFNTRQASLGQMDTVLNQVALHVRSRIQTAESNIALFANSILLENYMLTDDEGERYGLMQQPLYRLFSTYQKAYPEYYEIRILLPDGYEDARITSRPVPNIREEEGNTFYFKEMSGFDKMIYSTFFRNPDNGSVSFLIAQKLIISDKKVSPVGAEPVLRGYLAVTVDLDFLAQQTNTIKIGKTGSVFLTDNRGRILFHPEPSRVNKILSRALMDYVSEKNGEDIIAHKELSGKLVYYSGKRLHRQLVLFAALPESELSKATWALGETIAGITVVSIIFTIGLIFLALKFFIVRPIQKMNSAIQTVGKGDLGIQLEILHKDEIGMLAAEFNRMISKLRRLTVSRDYVDSILRSMSDAVVVISPGGKIDRVNRGACSLSGYDETDLTDRSMDSLFMEKRNSIKEIFYQIDEVSNIEKTVVTRENRHVPVLFSGSAMRNSTGEIEAIACVIKDITSLKLAEQEKIDLEKKLHRYRKMEALGILAGGVAHDLNNILSGIVSYPELLLLDLPKDHPMRGPILTIKKSGDKAVAIVQDLLTLARRGVAVTTPVNLNRIVSDYLKSPEYEKMKLYHRGLELETRLENDLFNIMASPVHMSKTVMNLISNAAEAMPGGGDITVATRNCYVDRPIKGYDEVNEGEYVTLVVSDTGEGIARKDLDKIFDPFYTKKVMGRSGSGLGMSVVWGSVKDHNGYIDIVSIPGQGTTFTLYFPVTRELQILDEPIPTIDNISGSGEKILVVDDIKVQRKIAARVLKRLGYAVMTVPSGEEALAYLAANTVDLVVLDMIMEPGMDGLDTFRKIIDLKPGQKAIITSGFSETERVKKALALGAGQYIKKPYSLETIGLAIKRELEK